MNKNTSLMSDSKGFSLPELMMATAIMGVLALGFMKLTQNGLEGGKRVEAGAQINEIKSEILAILSNTEACFYTFNPAHLDFTDVVGGGTKAISAIKDKNNITRFSVGQQFPGGVKLTSINVNDFNPASTTAGLLLGFDYNLNSNKKMDRIRRFDLQLELGGNTLEKCVALAGVKSIDPKQLCDTVVGFNSGASYFEGAECNFAKATCEKGGGIWDATNEKCGPSVFQKLTIREEACNAEGGKFVRPVKSFHYKLSGYMDDTEACTSAYLSTPDQCYCKTKWSKYYRTTGSGVGGAFPSEVTVPIQRNQQVGGYFTIPELFPTDVGPNTATADDKKRLTTIKMITKLQYLLPEGTLNYPAGFNTSAWMLEDPTMPFVLINFNIYCHSANSIAVGGSPSDWDSMPSLTSSGWPWSQGGNTYSTSYSHLGGYNTGSFTFNSAFLTAETISKRIYPAIRYNTGTVDWRNQYEVQVTVSALLEPGDKCILAAKPVFSSEASVSSFNLRFSKLEVKVDQSSNKMDIPQSNGN